MEHLEETHTDTQREHSNLCLQYRSPSVGWEGGSMADAEWISAHTFLWWKIKTPTETDKNTHKCTFQVSIHILCMFHNCLL